MAKVVSFCSRAPASRDWSNAELAELYRVENALIQANVSVETDRGLTDEGDPWFIFCRPDGIVLVHVARFDGSYHLYSPVLREPLVGASFEALTRAFAEVVPVSTRPASSGRVVMHPSALLGLLVATIFFSIDYLGETGGAAQAAEIVTPPAEPATPIPRHEGAARAILAPFLAKVNKASLAEGERYLSWISSHAGILVAATSLIDTAIQIFDDRVAERTTPAIASEADLTPASVGAHRAEASAKFAIALADDEGAGRTRDQSAPTATAVLPGAAAGIAVVSQEAPTPKAGESGPADGAALNAAAWDDSLVVTEGLGENLVRAPDILLVAEGVSLRLEVVDAHCLEVVLHDGNGLIRLGSASLLKEIKISGDGTLVIEGLSVVNAPQIVVAEESVQTLFLKYSTSDQLKAAQTVVLAGHSVVTFAMAEDGHHPVLSVDLTLVSDGAEQNTVNLIEPTTPNSTFNLKIVGSQDLILNEKVTTFNSAKLDVSDFSAHLTVGIDLSESTNATTLVNSSNFVAGEGHSVALLHVQDDATIDVGVSLQNLVAHLDKGIDPATLTIALSPGTNSDQVSVAGIGADGVGKLIIESDGSAHGQNKISAISDSALATLAISGSANLDVGAILGITAANSQSVLIDASTLQGGLTIDLTNIADIGSGGRKVTVVGGCGDDALTNLNASVNTVLTGGDGVNTFHIAVGTKTVTLTDLKDTDSVIVGSGSERCRVVDATAIPDIDQANFDSQSLLSAATMAAHVGAATGAHQAVLFSYLGTSYVFVDANGNHSFDAISDALVQLVGHVAASDLSGVFLVA